VGVGAERFARDIQVTRVETPRTALKGTSLVVNVVVTQTGTAIDRAIEVEAQRPHRQHDQITLPADGESADRARPVHGVDAGRRAVFKFGCRRSANEQCADNTREALIEVQRSEREDPLLRRRAAP